MDQILFTIIMVILFVFFILLSSKLLISTLLRKGKWGLNLKTVHCPRCGEIAPPIRKPTSFRQAMWGGWTCKMCECEMDKWGMEIARKNH